MAAVKATFAFVDRNVRQILFNDCLHVFREIMRRCWDSNPYVNQPFTKIVAMLGNIEVMTTFKISFYSFLF
jgi:hypothetical protein